eukprot:CAMPEP_0185577720 /NCGR_PEP_ID=MMETSP0434-20130131/10838_1 /TAXON_ID=626734 ORGANISM="Favella taraikaensis, Strain Fe Narragansett Bay" /NCGR_SAMPLE_ID=MMETSP0434 /ASSEMBLY_ACC=CAM_ASM_000379 /LENGTH=31 /DNA_ID= /DNA_START= /DNA_END= /DNA_ORIENTATION=
MSNMQLGGGGSMLSTGFSANDANTAISAMTV